MKRKIALFLLVLTLMLGVSAAPVYAGDDEDGSAPPPCAECDGGQVWSG
jgi:hypothetical protein